MTFVTLPAEESDDSDFIRLVNEIISGAVATHQPNKVHIFKIDHWFGHKWLKFSGKSLGAVGTWANQLTIPPFVANRIVGQRDFDLDDSQGTYHFVGKLSNIHHQGWAAENLTRSIQQVAPTAALFWVSGDTVSTGRGSLMSYIPVEQEHWPWFVAFARKTEWNVTHRKNIHEYELRMFQQSSENTQIS
jgi:hypothetical protein